MLVLWNTLDNNKSQVAPVPWEGWGHLSLLVLFPADPRPKQAVVYSPGSHCTVLFMHCVPGGITYKPRHNANAWNQFKYGLVTKQIRQSLFGFRRTFLIQNQQSGTQAHCCQDAQGYACTKGFRSTFPVSVPHPDYMAPPGKKHPSLLPLIPHGHRRQRTPISLQMTAWLS